MARDDRAAPAGRRRGFSLLLAVLALLLIVLFAGLGTWQVYRLQWKLDLIARVEARVHAAPAPVPSRTRWAGITPESDEYRRVKLHGTYLYDLTTPVQALTEAGSGYWLLTPMCTADGTIVLVNRGFIPAELGARTRYTPQRVTGNPCANAGPAADVTGLLRTHERPGAEPLVHPRRGRDRSGARARWISPRAVLRRRRRQAEPAGQPRPARRRPHRRQISKQSPRVRVHLVCSRLDGGRRLVVGRPPRQRQRER